MTQSSEYSSWKHMKSRCGNPNDLNYSRYGGRGIYVCEEWRDSFEAFLAHIGPKPTPAHEVDRYPDNNGPYAPGNVRWALRKEQCRNTRRNRHAVRADGERKTISEWSETTGIHINTLSQRLDLGMDADMALTLPPNSHYRMVTIDGETRNTDQWCVHFNLDPKTISERMKKGMTAEQAFKAPKGRGGRPRLSPYGS